mmetsp:Transcript_50178/g.144291  ORF Transcript_50178/g.144291 Transcript_50178/m.144291 type:complete len:221 (+) Transcript_50178:1328-1990(+)
MRGLVRDELDELIRDLVHVAAVPLADQRVAVHAQKSLHALTHRHRFVVDDLQEQYVARQDLVARLVQIEAQLRALAAAPPPGDGLQQMSDVGGAGHEDVDRALLRQRRWCNQLLPIVARGIEGVLVPRRVFVLLPGRHAHGGHPKGCRLWIPEQIQRRRVAPEVREADAIEAIRGYVLRLRQRAVYRKVGHRSSRSLALSLSRSARAPAQGSAGSNLLTP